MKKKLLTVLIAVVAVLVVALLTVAVMVDNLVRKGIETGAGYATGVKTTLTSADVGITSGELSMSGLNMANPEGYKGDHFLKLADGYVAVGLGSLTSDQIEVPKVELEGIDMVVERAGGKNNFDVILGNLKQLSSGEKQPREGGKTYIIRELILDDVSVSISGFGVGAQTIKLPPIKLTDVGSGGEGAQLSKVVGIVIRELMASLLKDPTKLPGMLADQLGSGLEGLGDLGQVGVEVIGKVGEEVGKQLENVTGTATEAADKISEEAGQAVEDVGKKAEEGLKGVTEGLGGMFGGDKKKDEETKE
ncbi:MAG: hypothetical protein IT445_01385 [Phycisphaeraceae bacterium]|nr:hypothetical protein [Phycisphaeraceae bacterium]